MRGANEHIFDKVLILGLMSRNTLSAATLSFAFLRGDSLDVTHMRHGNYHVFSFDEVGFADIRIIGGNFGFSRGGISVLYIFEIVSYDSSHSFGLLQNIFEVGNCCFELTKLFVELVYFHGCEPLKPHFENSRTLFIVEKESGFQLVRRVFFIFAAFDYRDNFVDVRKSYNQTFDDMLSFFGSR